MTTTSLKVLCFAFDANGCHSAFSAFNISSTSTVRICIVTCELFCSAVVQCSSECQQVQLERERSCCIREIIFILLHKGIVITQSLTDSQNI